MSAPVPDGDRSAVVRADQAEVLGRPPTMVRLLADASATGGSLSTIRVSLWDGANGANPHHHAGSAEMFYVLSGTAQVLSGEEVLTASEGDLLVVPPKLPHAFAAAPGQPADLLIVIAPGVERFEYFRHLARIFAGEATPGSLLEVQERYDTWFLESPAWTRARSG
jgi:mannose-6-phosphate isomerase-like protein (cupin superfamily)